MATLLPSITICLSICEAVVHSEEISISEGPSIGLLSQERPRCAPNVISSANNSFCPGDGPSFCRAACTNFSV